MVESDMAFTERLAMCACNENDSCMSQNQGQPHRKKFPRGIRKSFSIRYHCIETYALKSHGSERFFSDLKSVSLVPFSKVL